MKTFAKIAGIFVGVVVVLLIALVVFFPTERVKTELIKVAEAETQMPVSMGDVKLKILPSIAFELNDFEIGSKQHPIHASVKVVRVSSKLSSLWKDQIEITQILLDQPIIHLYTYHETEDKPQESPTTEAEQSTDSKGRAVSITSFEIRDGEIWMYDAPDENTLRVVDLDQNLRFDLPDTQTFVIDGQTSIQELWVASLQMPEVALVFDHDLTFRQDVKTLEIDKANLNIQDLPIQISGKASQQSETEIMVDLSLKTPQTQLTKIFALVPALDQDRWETSGLFEVDGLIQGVIDTENVEKSLEASKTHIGVTLEKGRLVAKEDNITFDPVAFRVTATPTAIKLHELDVTSKETTLHADAIVSNFMQEAQILANLDINANLKELQAWVPKDTASDLSGTLSTKIKLNGTSEPDDLHVEGTLNVNNATAYLKEMEYSLKDLELNASISDKATTLKNTSLKIADSDIEITQATLSPWKDWMEEEGALTFSFQGSSKNIAYKDVVPSSESDDENAPLVLPDIFYRLKGSGTYRVGTFAYMDTDFTNINATFSMKDGKVSLKPLSLNAFGGSMSTQGFVDFGPKTSFPFDVSLDMNDVRVQQALAFSTSVEELVQIKKALKAKVSLDTDAKGSLSQTLDLNISTLDAKGGLTVKDAQFANHPVQTKLASFLDTPSIQSFDVKKWKQKFKIQNGKLNIEDLGLAAKDFDFDINGYQSLDGSQRYTLDALLPKSVTKAINKKLPVDVGSALSDPKTGRVQVPIIVDGTLTNPKIKLDDDQIASLVKKNAKQELKAQSKDIQKDLKEKAKDSDTLDKAKEEAKDVGKKIKSLF